MKARLDVVNLTDNIYELRSASGVGVNAAQRDEFVQKLNDSIKSQNGLTTKYNELVEPFNKLQSNSVPPPKQP